MLITGQISISDAYYGSVLFIFIYLPVQQILVSSLLRIIRRYGQKKEQTNKKYQ